MNLEMDVGGICGISSKNELKSDFEMDPSLTDCNESRMPRYFKNP